MSIEIKKHTSYNKTNAAANRPLQYIVIHYTAGSTSRSGAAVNTADSWATGPYEGSADFVVDDELIVQYNPDLKNRLCWHCGDGKNYYSKGGSFYGKCTNYNSIGIEVCSTNRNYSPYDPANSPKWSFTNAAIEKAVELTKYLMQTYGIDADHVIRHYDVSGKLCPGIIGWNEDSGNATAWQLFKSRLTGVSLTSQTTKTDKSSINSSILYRVQLGAFKNKSNASDLLGKVKLKGFNDAFIANSNGMYKVQLGAFKDKTNAEKQKEKVVKAGFKDCFITSSGTAKKSVTEIAKEVIAGKWGAGNDRKAALEKAGYDYNAVQAKVNELMK